MAERTDLVERLVGWVLGRGGPVRLAVDGPDNAGKTTLADELAAAIRERGRHTIRASIDGFHRPAAERHRRGACSPEGYYEDSFDLDQLTSLLLDPLAPAGNRTYRPAVFDHLADQPMEIPEASAPEDAIVVFDGVFLLRPELVASWDLTVFLDIPEEEILRRALERDAVLMGDRVHDRYTRRYLPAQRSYRARVRPRDRADVVIDNTDPDRPVVIKAPWS